MKLEALVCDIFGKLYDWNTLNMLCFQYVVGISAYENLRLKMFYIRILINRIEEIVPNWFLYAADFQHADSFENRDSRPLFWQVIRDMRSID